MTNIAFVDINTLDCNTVSWQPLRNLVRKNPGQLDVHNAGPVIESSSKSAIMSWPLRGQADRTASFVVMIVGGMAMQQEPKNEVENEQNGKRTLSVVSNGHLSDFGVQLRSAKKYGAFVREIEIDQDQESGPQEDGMAMSNLSPGAEPVDMERMNQEYFGNATHWADIMRGCHALVAGEPLMKLTLCLSGITSGLDPTHRIHVMGTGESQTGKSYAMGRIGENLFGTRFELVNSASGKSIYYKCKNNPTAVKGTIRMYEELADQSEEMQNQVKALTSRGVDRLKLESVDEHRQFLSCSVDGLSVVWTNMALRLENPGAEQILNRFLKVNTDESDRQDQLVQEFQRREERLGPSTVTHAEAISKAKQLLSDIIGDGSHVVSNPFSEFINMKRLRHRGYRPMLCGLISAFTLSNRFIPSRPRAHNPDGRSYTFLVAHSDVMAGIALWAALERWQFSGVKERVLGVLEAMPDGVYVTPEELAPMFKAKYGYELAASTIYNHLHDAEKLDLVTSKREQQEVDIDPHGRERRAGRPMKVFKRLQMSRGTGGWISHDVYASSTVEYSVPKVESLAEIIQRDFPNFLREDQGAGPDIAERLLDFDYVPCLEKSVENSILGTLAFPTVQGSLTSGEMPKQEERE